MWQRRDLWKRPEDRSASARSPKSSARARTSRHAHQRRPSIRSVGLASFEASQTEDSSVWPAYHRHRRSRSHGSVARQRRTWARDHRRSQTVPWRIGHRQARQRVILGYDTSPSATRQRCDASPHCRRHYRVLCQRHIPRSFGSGIRVLRAYRLHVRVWQRIR